MINATRQNNRICTPLIMIFDVEESVVWLLQTVTMIFLRPPVRPVYQPLPTILDNGGILPMVALLLVLPPRDS